MVATVSGVLPIIPPLHSWWWLVWLLAALLGGCAGNFEQPAPTDVAGLRAHAVSKSEHGFRVSATIPDPQESMAIFGVDLAANGIQPLWLEIDNNTDRLVAFLPTGLDPEYFSPLEVAFSFHSFSGVANREVDAHFETLGFEEQIAPHSRSSGFIYTNLDKGVKIVNIDLVGRHWSRSLALLVPLSGRIISAESATRFTATIPESELIEVSGEDRLRVELQRLPCCTRDVVGNPGPPLNFVMIGDADAWIPAFTRRSYRFSEADDLYAFGRKQDVMAAKRDRWVAAQPLLARAWLTPIRYQGEPVWVGQASSPWGGRFGGEVADSQPQDAIDPDVDQARDDLLQDMIYSQSLAKAGYVLGGETDSERYFGNGLRVVFVYAREPVPLSEIEFFKWERLIDYWHPEYRQTSGPSNTGMETSK